MYTAELAKKFSPRYYNFLIESEPDKVKRLESEGYLVSNDKNALENFKKRKLEIVNMLKDNHRSAWINNFQKNLSGVANNKLEGRSDSNPTSPFQSPRHIPRQPPPDCIPEEDEAH